MVSKARLKDMNSQKDMLIEISLNTCKDVFDYPEPS